MVFTLEENKLQYYLNNVEYRSKKFFCTQTPAPDCFQFSYMTIKSTTIYSPSTFIQGKNQNKEEKNKIQIKDIKKE